MSSCYILIGEVGPCIDATAWAAWAQAILTVATFAGTVMYQARQNARIRVIEHYNDFARMVDQMLQIAQLLRGYREIYAQESAADRATARKDFDAANRVVKRVALLDLPPIRVNDLGQSAGDVGALLLALDGLKRAADGGVPTKGERPLEERAEDLWALMKQLDDSSASTLAVIERVMVRGIS